MLRNLVFAVAAVAVLAGNAAAQPFDPDVNPIFDDTVLPSIFVEIDEADLDAIMADVHSDVEYPARFVFDNGSIRDTVENVGFRLRGNTARTPPKKSFKISFNTFERGRKFYGLEKLNVNGEHNDPSIMRSKLGWDLFGQLAVPASRANHVKLFVNGAYYGLYVNVEHIDEQFLQSRFGNDDGNLYKCLWPADLTYLGPDAADYRPQGGDRRPYDLTQGASDEEGYGDLARFIDVVNNRPDASFREEIEAIFDVNGYLRTMAMDVVLGNWDNYWYLKNNFYLYNNPETGLFHFIPFDIDNTFGIDFVDGDWGRRDPYTWGHPTEPRPLTERILNIPEYRDRYTFYVRRLLEGPARPVPLTTHAGGLRSMIEEAAEADPFHRLQWEWEEDSFNRSYTAAIGGHVEYGLYPFIVARTNSALGRLDDVDVVPILSGVHHEPARPAASDPVRFRVLVENEAQPVVELRYRLSDGTEGALSMHDDGQSGDLAAGDGYFGAALPPLQNGDVITYRIHATDAAGQTGTTSEYHLEIGHQGPALFINEIMASNETTLADPFGEFDDWVEIYNASEADVPLAGYGLTDDLDVPFKWTFDDVTIPAGGFLLVWTDNDPEQGPLHTSFRLDLDGEEIGLYDPSGAAVSTFSFGAQEADVSYGRDPDGGGGLGRLARATPGSSNNGTSVGAARRGRITGELSIRAYPNPFSSLVTVDVEVPRDGAVTVDVYDVLGRRVRRLADGRFTAGHLRLSWDGTSDRGARLGNGVYVLRARGASGLVLRSIVLAH